ncbi:MAG: efflux RND transporter permease subunit [Rhodothermales bacterium]
MSFITDISVKRPIATTMFYLVIITVGLVGLRFLPVDLLPSIEYTRLSVNTNYPNVGPEEIETIITDRIENAVASVPNIERVSSRSSDGNSRVSMEFSRGVDLSEASNDVRDAMNRVVNSLPPEVDPPRLWKFDLNSFPIIIIAAQSTREMDDLTLMIERDIAQRFERIPGVGSIDVWGGVYREIHIDLDRDRLKASGLTAQDVQQAISQENATLPGGNVKQGLSDLYVRTRGEYTSVDQIARTVVTIANGKAVRVQDLGEVIDGYEDISRLVELQDVPMIRFFIQKQSGANTVDIAERVRAEVERVNLERSDLKLTVVSDQSTFIQQSMDNVQSSAFWGALLALLILYVFLRNGSTTFIISLSIPISLVATFGLLYFSDMTLNQMTFGGLALGIGMIVDNAIVVLENIVRIREERGESLANSAVIGTKQVTGAIVASTLTTSVIFLPLAFAQTTSGALFQALAIVVVFALMCSLLVALSLVPMLASRFLSAKKGGEVEAVKKSRLRTFFRNLENWYSQLLKKSISKRPAIFIATILLVGTAAFFWSSIPVELAPQSDADEISIDMEMAEGMNIAVVRQYLDELAVAVKAVLPMDQVETITTEVRNGDAEVEVTLIDANIRTVSSTQLADEIRNAVDGLIPGANIRVSAQSGLWILRRLFSSSDDAEAVQIEIRGYDLETASSFAQQIQSRVSSIPGVRDARVSRREGQPEENLIFDRDRISDLGLTVNQVAQAVQANVGGVLAGQFRVKGDEFPIRVRLRPEDRLTSLDLDDIGVRTPAGEIVPISSITTQEKGRSPTTISRVNGQRVTYVTANLEDEVALGEAVARIRADLAQLALPEGFSIIFSGEYEEQIKAQRDFTMAIFMALILIYMVMAGQFERFLDPLIVMCSVPLAIVGVVPMLIFTGDTLNMQSIIGLVMLIGIVVNNAIVLVDYINLLRREREMNLVDAIVEAGRLRLRPILMTALTTILGLVPMALGFGVGAEIQASLARVVIGGLLASTIITLILIPLVYLTAHRAKKRVNDKVKAMWNNWRPRPGTESSIQVEG